MDDRYKNMGYGFDLYGNYPMSQIPGMPINPMANQPISPTPNMTTNISPEDLLCSNDKEMQELYFLKLGAMSNNVHRITEIKGEIIAETLIPNGEIVSHSIKTVPELIQYFIKLGIVSKHDGMYLLKV